MTGRVEGKVALVTGGAAGIGKAICEKLALEGASVVITDIDAKGGEALAAQICASGQKAIFIQHDVTKEDQWNSCVERVENELGQLDILVNNAGVVIPKTVEETTLEEFRWLMSINMDAVFLGTQKAVTSMKKSGGGSIINMCSIQGLVGEAVCPAYNASKGGVRIFSKGVALDCANNRTNIRVNTVHPGYVLTPLVQGAMDKMEDGGKAFLAYLESKHPVGHLGEAEDVAYGVLYLASDESKFCTGSELVIDGGYTAQ